MLSTVLFPVAPSDTTKRMFCTVRELVGTGAGEIAFFHTVEKREAEAVPGRPSNTPARFSKPGAGHSKRTGRPWSGPRWRSEHHG